MPLQREAMAELLADLLLDNDLMDAQVELLLPLEGVHWRVLDGIEPGQFEQAKPALADLPWPLQAQESYTALTTLGTAHGSAMVVLGVTRVQLQAWIDVIEQADLVLRRVDWCLSSALRGLLQLTHPWSGNLAWLIQDGPSCRLVLLSSGVPELDQVMTTPVADLEGCQREIRAWLTAWQQRSPLSVELGWWLSVAHDQADLWRTLVDGGRGERLLHQDLPPFESVMDSSFLPKSLEPLEHLALLGSLMQNDRPDLLRDRRLELGLPPMPPPLRPARGLVLLGSGVGLLLVLVVAAFQWLAQAREQSLQAHVAEVGAEQAAALKICSAKGGSIEAGETQIGVAQISPVETRLAEVRALQLGPFQICILQLGVHEIDVC